MSRIKWSKERILLEIQKIQDNGEPLNSGHVQKNHNTVHQAAFKHFGSWESALKELGIDYNSVKKRESWNKTKIRDTILDYYKKGVELSSRKIRGKNYKLYSAARLHFGSWREAVLSAGLDYDKILKREFWSKEKVLNKIKELNRKGNPLNPDYIIKNHSKLMNAARKYYGSWKNAIEATGSVYEEIIKPPGVPSVWNKESIIEKIQELYESGRDISFKEMKKDYQSLLTQAKNCFGSYREAIEQAGINYENISKKIFWDKERVLDNILELRDAGENLNAAHITENHNKLIMAALRYFGSWENAIEAVGLDYNEIKTRENWDKEKIIGAIKDLAEKGEKLRYAETYYYNSKLVDAARNYFGSWKLAVEAAGLPYKSYSKNEILLGNLLEEYAKEIFSALGFNYKFKPRFNIQGESFLPDFYDRKTRTWIDIKLSVWSPGIRKTIKRYNRFADKLLIYYLKGKPCNWKNNKIICKCFKDYYPEIRNANRDDLIRDLSLIERGILPNKGQKSIKSFNK